MSAETLFPSKPLHWRVSTLGELAKESGGGIQTGPFGSQLHAEDYVDDGIPSVMPKNISIDGVTTHDIARVSIKDIERLAKYKLQIGDIVYSRRGDIEKCARITVRENGWLCGTGCLRVRVIPKIVTPEFLHAYLCHPVVREWIVRHSVGATMPNLNTSILSALPIIIPSETEIKVISSVWLNISKKIQLNRQINQTLESMAQAIFQSWFVDFDPVKAKIAAREQWQILTDDERTEWLNELLETQDYFKTCLLELTANGEQSASETLYLNIAAMTAISSRNETSLADMPADEFAQLYKTASLFPERLVESELGEIPEGWRISCVDDICHFQNGYAFKSKEMSKSPSDSYKVFKMGHIKKGGGLNQSGTKDYFEKKKSDKLDRYLIKKGDLLMCMTDMKNNVALLGHTALMDVTDEYVLNQRVGLLRSKNTKIANYSFLYILTNSECFIEDLRSRANSGVQVNLSTKEIKETKFILPSEGVHIAFDRVVERGQETKFSIEAEQQYLAELRDTLLPKLLSGELDVSSLTELSDIDPAAMDV